MVLPRRLALPFMAAHETSAGSNATGACPLTDMPVQPAHNNGSSMTNAPTRNHIRFIESSFGEDRRNNHARHPARMARDSPLKGFHAVVPPRYSRRKGRPGRP